MRKHDGTISAYSAHQTPLEKRLGHPCRGADVCCAIKHPLTGGDDILDS